MFAAEQKNIIRRPVGENIWLNRETNEIEEIFARTDVAPDQYESLESEEAVGQAMLDELKAAARAKSGDVTMLLLGGRGAQAMYRQIGKAIPSGELDELLSRLHIFTQDALAPMRMNNGLSFVRDFEPRKYVERRAGRARFAR